MKTATGKQSAADLAFNDRDWTRQLPAGYSLQLRINATETRSHRQANGQIKHCTDMQWYMGGGAGVAGVFGSALMLVDSAGEEVPVQGWRQR